MKTPNIIPNMKSKSLKRKNPPNLGLITTSTKVNIMMKITPEIKFFSLKDSFIDDIINH